MPNPRSAHDPRNPSNPNAPRPRSAAPSNQRANAPVVIRLSKCVAELAGCSRAEAECYIQGGWVRVNGVVIEQPGHRIASEKIELDPHASLLPQPAITMLLHKPPDFDALQGRRPALQLISAASHARVDASKVRMLQQHFADLTPVTPLETGASGLVIFTKDWAVQRKLVEDASRIEHEVIAEVRGELTERTLRALNRSQVIDGRAMLAAKVSVSHQPDPEPNLQSGVHDPITGLRFAIKGYHPGQIKQLCEGVGLQLLSIKRIRVGRVMMSSLPEGQWRYLAAHERF